ncbi:uncharacterized protein PAC_15408 [Phialocephala subalpina]|uniref:Uncharacterized protein n=1 Tax=Phialocephala subalpina TaxID=576137 RepID=A0A1L7XKG3_9HELO|nr:uncharacterized protein PAC_15408 [Phialocephala subalpina]
MFKSYLFSKEHQYMPVSVQSDGQCQLPMSNDNKAIRRRAFVYALLVLEALHLILFLAVYAGMHVFSDIHLSHELDTYFALSEFNTVKTFYGDWALMNRSAESDALFEQIQKCMYGKAIASHALSKFRSAIS